MEETVSCFCNACSTELGQFRNAWNMIGSNYYCPVYPSLSFEDGFTGKGDVRSVTLGKLEPCFLQDLACKACRVYVGVRCHSAPNTHLLKKNQYLLRLSELTTRVTGTKKKADIAVKNTFLLEPASSAMKRPASRAPSVSSSRSKSSHAHAPSKRDSYSMPPPPKPVPKVHESPAPGVTSPSSASSSFQIWAEKEIKDQRMEIGRIAGAVDRMENSMHELKALMEELREERREDGRESELRRLQSDVDEILPRLKSAETKSATAMKKVEKQLNDILVAKVVNQDANVHSDGSGQLFANLTMQIEALTARIDMVETRHENSFGADEKDFENPIAQSNYRDSMRTHPEGAQTLRQDQPQRKLDSLSHAPSKEASGKKKRQPLQTVDDHAADTSVHNQPILVDDSDSDYIESSRKPSGSSSKGGRRRKSGRISAKDVKMPADVTKKPADDRILRESTFFPNASNLKDTAKTSNATSAVEVSSAKHHQEMIANLSSPAPTSSSPVVEASSPIFRDKRKRRTSLEQDVRPHQPVTTQKKKRKQAAVNRPRKKSRTDTASSPSQLQSPDVEVENATIVGNGASPDLDLARGNSFNGRIKKTVVDNRPESTPKSVPTAQSAVSAYASSCHANETSTPDPTTQPTSTKSLDNLPPHIRKLMLASRESFFSRSFDPKQSPAAVHPDVPLSSVETDHPRHTAQTPQMAQKFFASGTAASTHSNSTPTPEQMVTPYKCGGCSRRFAKIQGLKVHKNIDARCRKYTARDSIPNDFVCSGCHGSFMNLAKFNAHQCKTVGSETQQEEGQSSHQTDEVEDAEKRRLTMAAREKLVRETMEREMTR